MVGAGALPDARAAIWYGFGIDTFTAAPLMFILSVISTENIWRMDVAAPIKPVKSPLDDGTVSLTSLDNAVVTFITKGAPKADDLRWHHSQTVAYSSIKSAHLVTGVRSDSSTSSSVVITASTVLPGGETVASVYQGTLQALRNAPASKWDVFQPKFANQTVTSSTFYGPNTALFDPSLGVGNIRAVGSYKYNESA